MSSLFTPVRNPNCKGRPDISDVLSLVARLGIAVPGGYGLMALWTGFLARSLPQSRLEATLTASLLSFLLGMTWVVYVFATPSARRVALVMLLAAIVPVFGFILTGWR